MTRRTAIVNRINSTCDHVIRKASDPFSAPSTPVHTAFSPRKLTLTQVIENAQGPLTKAIFNMNVIQGKTDFHISIDHRTKL